MEKEKDKKKGNVDRERKKGNNRGKNWRVEERLWKLVRGMKDYEISFCFELSLLLLFYCAVKKDGNLARAIR